MTNIIEGPEFESTEDRSFGVFFFEQAEKYKNRICQINGDTGKKETFQEVKTKSTRLAMSMIEHGIKKNDVVVCCISNNEHNAIPVIATLYLGAKIASLDPTLSARDSNHLIKLVAPKIIFVEESALHLIEENMDTFVKNTKIVVVGKSEKYLQYSDMIKPKPGENSFAPTSVDCREGAVIFFSSGSTGLPKGIELTHFGLFYSVYSLLAMEFLKPDVMLHFTSLYWISAFIVLSLNHIAGTSRVTCAQPSGEKIFQIIQDYKVSFTFASPTIGHLLTNVPNFGDYDTSSLFSVMLGGCAANLPQLEKIRSVLPHSNISYAYGMTECSFISGFNYKTENEIHKKKSSGKIVSGLKVKIVDPETGNILPPTEKGEICVLSPCIMKGYYNADASQNFDNENYLKTGDIGYFDEDGFIYVVDRIKEMFKYKSWHIVPASLESIICEHPNVSECVVFGLPHEEDGDHPAALVVALNGSKIKPEEIEEFVAQRVIDRQRLRGGVFIVDSLPKTVTGKINRKEIKSMYSKISNK